MRRTIVAAIGIAICLGGITLSLYSQVFIDEKTALVQETISLIKGRLEEEKDLELLGLLAALLQELITGDHQLVAQAYARILEISWDQKNEKHVYEALTKLKDFENKVVLSSVIFPLLEISKIDIYSRSWRGWERSQKLARDILDRVIQQSTADELYELIVSEKSVISVKQWALSILAQKPEEATRYLLPLIKFVGTQQGQALFANIMYFVDTVPPLPKKDWEACIALLETEDQRVQLAAAQALKRVASELGDLGSKALPLVVKMIRSSNKELSDLATSILCRMAGSAPEVSLPVLIELLQENPSRSMLAQAVRTAAPIPEDKIGALANIINSWDWRVNDEVRAFILGALLKSGPNAENIALNFIKEHWIRSRRTIPYEIVKVIETDLQKCDAELAEYLLQYKGQSGYANAFRRATLPACLTQAIRDEIEDCLKRLTMRNHNERRTGADILAWMGPVAAFVYEAVLEALEKEKIPEVREALGQALIEMGAPETKFIQRLILLTNHEDPIVRKSIAAVLGNVPVDVAIRLNVLTTLQKMAKDEDLAVRKAALSSLIKLLHEL